jgi:hypothetical protein
MRSASLESPVAVTCEPLQSDLERSIYIQNSSACTMPSAIWRDITTIQLIQAGLAVRHHRPVSIGCVRDLVAWYRDPFLSTKSGRLGRQTARSRGDRYASF